ncbi:MAG: hypothetical protein K8U03_02455 [Planctomycetia bacterium]|nr:hypothetical protein [Planctomycetia bacterium]
MKPIVIFLVFLAFTASLPRRHVPRPWIMRAENRNCISAATSVRPLDRYYYVLPPVRREVGVVDLVAPDAEVAPAFGTAAMLYGIALYLMGDDGYAGYRIFLYAHEAQPLLVAGALALAIIGTVHLTNRST